MHLLLLLAAPALANHPAWVAELSSHHAHRYRETEITVAVPAGEHTTVGVYNTDAVDVQVPEGVTSEKHVIWYEVRTVYHGQEGEREVAVPYYLPPPEVMPQMGSWAVKLHAEEPGQYAVPIACNSDTVTVNLDVTPPVGPSDTGLGFYTDYNRFAYFDLDNERRYFEHMAELGCNTLTIYSARVYTGDPLASQAWCSPHSGESGNYWALSVYDVRRQLDLASEVGLLHPDVPVLCLSIPEDRFAEHMDACREGAKHADQWPELLAYNSDEAGPGHRPQMTANQEVWDCQDVRNGSATYTSSIMAVGDTMDLWLPSIQSWSPLLAAKAEEEGALLGQYICVWRGTNAPMHRYMTGIWRWVTRPKTFLAWAYMNDHNSRVTPEGEWNALRSCEYAIASKDGPISSVGLEGWRDGSVDYRVLRELERAVREASVNESASINAINEACAFLKRVSQMYRPGFVTEPDGPYTFDGPDTMEPPVDCVAVRNEALELLAELR